MKDEKIEIELSVCKTPQKYSNRNLELQSDEFVRHINEYEQWLRVLGYANSTIYNFYINSQETYKKETLFSERQTKDAIFSDVLVLQR